VNKWDVKAKPKGMRFMAVIYRVDRAKPYALGPEDEPQLFHCALDAELAGLRHILFLLQTEERFSPPPPKAPEVVALEEATFGRVTSRKGKSSVVHRRKRRAKNRANAEAAAQAVPA
jgi:hypothetical protein